MSSNTYTPVLTNKRRYPYTIVGDSLTSKFELYYNRRISYLSNLPVELWLNIDDTWAKYVDAVTNRYGIVPNIEYSTDSIPQINNCLGYAKVTIDGLTYYSNLVRYNFI